MKVTYPKDLTISMCVAEQMNGKLNEAFETETEGVRERRRAVYLIEFSNTYFYFLSPFCM